MLLWKKIHHHLLKTGNEKHMKSIRSYAIYIAVFLAFFSLSIGVTESVEAQEIQAELLPETFSIDETATLQITVRDAQNGDIAMPEVNGLIFHHRGKSSQVQIVNGTVTSSVVYTYLVEPVKDGTYEIPPIQIDIDDQTLRTEPLTCTVTKSSGNQLRQPSTEAEKTPATSAVSFISFLPEKLQIYRGEVIPAKIKVYFKRGTRVNQLSLPRMQGEGLLIDELSNDPNRTEEIVNNVAYSVLIWDTFITGVKEGVHDSSFELDATLLVPSRNRSTLPGFGSGFFSDDFFGDMFSGYSSTPVKVTSEKTAIEVMTLPESSKPDGFSGAIGTFTLNLDVQPTTIDPGEPVTLTMSVTGNGNFTGVEAPTVSNTDHIKMYKPTAVFTPDQSPYNGTKEFQQAIILTDPSIPEIPPVTFSYFDPAAKQYRTLISDPVTITVNTLTVEDNSSPQPLPAQTADSPDSSPQTGSISVSLVPVKLEPGKLVDHIRPPFLAAWFMTAVSLCLMLIAGFFGYQIYRKIQDRSVEAVYKKALIARQKETLTLLDGLNPNAPDYPAQARKLVGDLLAVHQHSDSVSLTTADVIDRYGSDSVVTELFKLGDGALYGKQEDTGAGRLDLHRRIQTFVTKIS